MSIYTAQRNPENFGSLAIIDKFYDFSLHCSVLCELSEAEIHSLHVVNYQFLYHLGPMYIIEFWSVPR